MAWFESSTPVLDQFGSTIGRGLRPTGATSANGMVDDERAFFEALGDEDARRWDLDYSLKKSELDQQYKIAKLNARTARERSEIDKWYNEQQVRLAGERLAFDRESFEKTHGLNQAKLGADLVGTLANLSGPENYFKAADYARGIASMPQTAGFLSALRDNTNLTGFGQQGGIPDPETYGSLMGKLGAPGAAGSTAAGASSWTPDANNLATIGGLGARGAHKLGAGSLEGLTDTERKLFAAGLGEVGFDTNTFMDQYRRSRIGQGFGSSTAA
jgi:hypothetical protein